MWQCQNVKINKYNGCHIYKTNPISTITLVNGSNVEHIANSVFYYNTI